MDNAAAVLAVLGVLGAGLVGGALYGFSTFIMAALARVPDAEGIRAMQAINVTVFRPLFIGVFFLTTPVSLAGAALGLMNIGSAWAPGMIVGGLAYALGLFLVTAVGNVPLNKKLEDIDPEGDPAFWRMYLVVWTRWNHVRSVATVISLLGFSWALLGM